MPPVQHIAFFELPCRGRQNLFTRNLGPRIDKRHHVLQLIAKTKSTTRLIKSGAAAHATSEDLAKQPAIHECVHRCVRCSDLNRAQRLVPEIQPLVQRLVHHLLIPKTRVDGARLFNRFALAEKEDDLAQFAGRQIDRTLNRGAGSQAGAIPATQTRTAQRRRIDQRAVTADELFAIAGHRKLLFAGPYERHAIGKLVVVRIPSEDGAFVFLEISHYMRRRLLPELAEHQLNIIRDRKSAAPLAAITQSQKRDFYRRVERSKQEQLLRDALTGMLKDGVTLSMTNRVRVRLSDRQRRWRPQRAGVFVTDVNNFAGRIAHCVIGPRRQPVLMTVDGPGKAAPGFRHQESKIRIIGDDVTPGRGCRLSLAQRGYVFPTGVSKSAHAVEKRKFRNLQ